MYSTVRGAVGSGSGSAAGAGSSCWRSARSTGPSATGSSTQKQLPCPTVDDTSRLPPMASASRLDSGSPSPAPSTPVCSLPSRSKGTNSWSMASGAIPGPLSRTRTRMRSPSAGPHSSSTRPPGGCT